MKSKVSEQSRAAKVRAAADQGGKPPGGLRLGGQRPSGPGAPEPRVPRAPGAPKGDSKSFVLRTYIVGGIGEKSYILING